MTSLNKLLKKDQQYDTAAVLETVFSVVYLNVNDVGIVVSCHFLQIFDKVCMFKFQTTVVELW